MVPVLIAVCILSISGMAFMLWRKMQTVPHTKAPSEVVSASIPHPHHIRSMLKDGIKEGVHAVMMGIAKGWMLLGKSWRKMLEKHFPVGYDVLYGKPSTDLSQSSSFFLSTISEYKVKMKRLKEKMKKEEKTKKAETTLPQSKDL